MGYKMTFGLTVGMDSYTIKSYYSGNEEDEPYAVEVIKGNNHGKGNMSDVIQALLSSAKHHRERAQQAGPMTLQRVEEVDQAAIYQGTAAYLIMNRVDMRYQLDDTVILQDLLGKLGTS